MTDHLLVLVEQLVDERVLPHDLAAQDGVEAGDVARRFPRHHLVRMVNVSD